ncbi:MAG TPA: DNA internalization-related competence protein ComEC/Rec2 [Burkholderiales bacterium]
MTPAAIAFACGAALLQWQAALPEWEWVWALPFLALGILLSRRFLFVFALAAGFLWASTCAHLRMADWLAPELEARDIEVVGVVSSLPARVERGVRFELDTEAAPDSERLPNKLLLSWYGAGFSDGAAPLEREVHPGERYRLTVRLKRPHGNVNPNGFDYEAWLLERGIGATGYVRRGEWIGLRNSVLDRVEQAREAIRERFERQLGATPAAGILIALAVGDQRAISNEEWRLFNRTGVTHLMSISGLHVTLVSGLAAFLVAFGWRRVPALALRMPARKSAALAAIFGALGYTLLAGFGVPAQRTFYMVSVVALALWSGRIAAPSRTLALALAAVVAFDPWAPLSPGLWLSFGAVGIIFYVALKNENQIMQWARVQWAITVGLAPASLLLFGQISIAGPLANAIAIPVVSVVVTPLALAAAVLPVPAILDVAAWLVEWLLQFLEWCAALPGALWEQHVPALWSVALALLGVAWLLAPRGVPWRAAGLALIAPAFLVAPPAPPAGAAWITALDVGQGLAVIVRTSGHTLLFDAGPAFGPEADSGGRVVVPVLRAAGVPRLDAVVLSHEDRDHTGGALTVLETLEAGVLYSSLPPAHPLNTLAPSRRCASGQQWEWDGVRFEFLHPAPGRAWKRNDASCVLRIEASGGSLLLTGDIERGAEKELSGNSNVKSDVLLVPHHGSKTSSTEPFIAAVAPRWAVVTAGYRNRFGHPNEQVLERYRAAGVEVRRTDREGALQVVLDGQPSVAGERARRGRYWLQ